jgi:hypothetical protein
MAKKRGPLNAQDLFYIQQNPDGLTAEELADNLNRSMTQIKKVLKDTEEQQTKAAAEPDPEKKPEGVAKAYAGKSLMQQMMARKKRRPDTKVEATAMTQAASQLGDETRKRSKLPSKMQKAIHKPYKDE